MVISAKPCECCQVQPVWCRWSDFCFLCAASEFAVTWVMRLGHFIWAVTERPKPKLPVARIVRDE